MSSLGVLRAEDRDIWPITDFKIQGTGATNVLIIPCMSCRWRAFDKFMERNQDHYTMYAITIPGFGGSEIPELPMWSDQPVWQENALTAVENFIDKHNIKDAIVVSHSWGSVLAVQLLARRDDFAKSWIILDTYVPFDKSEQTLPYSEKVKLAAKWREDFFHPLYSPDEWANFNKPSPYMPHDRQILYYGMFMATPREVVFQYWRENGLRNINTDFGKVNIPVLEVKSISPIQPDPEDAKKRYRARYDTMPTPKLLRTVFIKNTGHYQVEQRPEIIDEIVRKVVSGDLVEDYDPPQ